MLHPELKGFVKAIQRRQLKWQLQTSMPLAEEDDFDIMVPGGVMMISIDGLCNTHDYYRGPGSYARALEVVGKAVAKQCTVRVNTVVTQRNMHELRQLLLLSGQVGVQIHSFFYFSPIGRGRQIATEWIPPAEYVTLGREMRVFADSHRQSLPPLIYFQFGYSETARGVNFCQCRAKRRDFIVVLADGRALPCTWYIDTTLSLGSAVSTSLSSLYENLLRFADDIEPLPSGCRDCHLKTVCGGGCPAATHIAEAMRDPRCVAPSSFFPGCPEAKSEL